MQQEDDDRRDLDRGEPELELAVGAHRPQVGRGHQDREHQRHQPQRPVDPALQDAGARHRLEADDDHPEVPVQPTAGEPRAFTERAADELGERAELRVRGGHLAEHPHHEHDQDAREHVREDRGRTGDADHRARADEQPGADHASQRDHGQMPLLQRGLQVRGLRCRRLLRAVGHTGRCGDRHTRLLPLAFGAHAPRRPRGWSRKRSPRRGLRRSTPRLPPLSGGVRSLERAFRTPLLAIRAREGR